MKIKSLEVFLVLSVVVLLSLRLECSSFIKADLIAATNQILFKLIKIKQVLSRFERKNILIS